MNIRPFALERYFARYEFSVRHQLSTSDCETITVGELLEAAGIREPDGLLGLRLGYTESAGDPELREAIAGTYPGISAGMVLTAAPAEAIFVLFNTLLRPGDRVMVIDPCYQSLSSLPEAIGCEVLPWPLRLEGLEWRLDLDELKKALFAARPPAMVAVNFPHNPTGFLPAESELSEMAELCHRAGVHFFCDEMYRELSLFGRRTLPSACTLSPSAVCLGGLSKSHGLPGLRMGWLVSQNEELIRKTAEMKDYTTICSPPPSEYLAKAALSAAGALTARARAIVEENCRLSEERFTADGRFTWIPPAGGSVAFPLYNGKEGATVLSERLIREADTLLLPGPLFGRSDRHFRTGLGRTGYPEALSRLLATAGE